MLVGWARTQDMVLRMGNKIEALSFVIKDPGSKDTTQDHKRKKAEYRKRRKNIASELRGVCAK